MAPPTVGGAWQGTTLKTAVLIHVTVSPAEGVALLPFVDERRLRAALADVYPNLTSEEGEQLDWEEPSIPNMQFQSPPSLLSVLSALSYVLCFSEEEQSGQRCSLCGKDSPAL